MCMRPRMHAHVHAHGHRHTDSCFAVVQVGLQPPEVCRLRVALANAPLQPETRQPWRWWRVAGGGLIAGSGNAQITLRPRAAEEGPNPVLAPPAREADGRNGMQARTGPWQLDDMLPAAADVLRALAAAEAELRRRGECASATRPVVLSGPEGVTRRLGACALPDAMRTPEQSALVARQLCQVQTAASSERLTAPTVLCGDGVCRSTFIHCHRSVVNAGDDLLASALPPCASAARREALEAALPFAGVLLIALSSFDSAVHDFFPDAC